MMDKLLVWLQERIKLWTKPVTSSLAVGILSDLTRSRADLVVENALLRQQLIILKRQVKRPQPTNADRIHLILLALCWLLASSARFSERIYKSFVSQ
jgi:hypothetical protein